MASCGTYNAGLRLPTLAVVEVVAYKAFLVESGEVSVSRGSDFIKEKLWRQQKESFSVDCPGWQAETG